MKFLIMFIILTVVTFTIPKNSINNYFPDLPMGEFKMYTKAIIRCHTKEYALETNLYLNKMSNNSSELRGNITLKQTIDDSFSLLLNFAVKDSIGGWKNNFYTVRLTKLCTSMNGFIDGAARAMLANNFGYNGYCPIPPGVYVSKGLDIPSLVSKMNIPKQSFYGTYKCKFEIFEKNGKQSSCFQVIFDIKRPWETAD